MVDFWEVHGILFIIFMFFFPRLTMLFATAWGGPLWWIGWLFAPRLTVAIVATSLYWETNTVLVVIEGAANTTTRPRRAHIPLTPPRRARRDGQPPKETNGEAGSADSFAG